MLDLASGNDILSSAPSFSSPNTVSTYTSDICPVFVIYPAAMGFPAKRLIYYLGSGFDSNLRVVEYDMNSGQKAVLPKGYTESSYSSLQSAVNVTSASYALVAQGDAYNGKLVNLYTKPTYYSSPSLNTCYLDMRQPTIMVENVSAFGSPNWTIQMKSNLNTTWYQASPSGGLTQTGVSIAGFFTREQTPSSDRISLVIRTNVTPARIDVYSGSGYLSKESELAVDTRAYRSWKGMDGKEQMAAFDFAGSDVVILDSLESDATICAVRYSTASPSGMIVRQADSLAKSVGVAISRNGIAVSAYAASCWTGLGTASLSGLQTGDVIKFTLPERPIGLWGYKELSLRGQNLKKSTERDVAQERLTPLAHDLQAYPNPFNPTTRIQYSLPEASLVDLRIYDVLGREVEVLSDGYMEAGLHTAIWNAASAASGIYYARLSVRDESGKALFTKSIKLLLVK
ncbi:MAG: T9SS type A sorting domain-containing protein [Bacteroidota bacterium]